MKVNGTRVEDLAGTGLVTKQRYVVPLWASVVGVTLRFLARLAWVVIAWAFRAWLVTLPAALVAVAYWRAGGLGVAALLAVTLAAGLAWAIPVAGLVLAVGWYSGFVVHGAGTSRTGGAGTRRWTAPA